MDQPRTIRIRLASENNLRNLSLDIPHQQLIAITGLSGSGKSSLAHDTIAQEGQRRFFETFPAFSRQFLGKISRPRVEAIEGLSPVISLAQSSATPGPRSTVGTLSDIHDHLRLLFARLAQSPAPLSRSAFSYNKVQGACPTCKGLGQEEIISPDKVIADPAKTLREGALAPTLPTGYIMYSQVTIDVLDTLCRAHGFTVDQAWQDLAPDQQAVILRGSDLIKVPFGKHSLESRLKWTGITPKPREEGHYKGILTIMEDILRRDRNKNILRYAESRACTACGGSRLNEGARQATLKGKNIVDLSRMDLGMLKTWLEETDWTATEVPIAGPICAEMNAQISLLQKLGLGHLHSERAAQTLSPGEIQRIRLVNQVASQMAKVLYIFDEPAIGMHPQDKQEVIAILRRLVQNGNTVLLVEHDLDSIRQADWIVDIGPGAGDQGGALLFNGPLAAFLDRPELADTSATYRSLKTQTRTKFKPTAAPEAAAYASFTGCKLHNLQDLGIRIQRGALNVVTGVAGAGKSSLVHGEVKRRVQQQIESDIPKDFDKIITISQKPIGRTPRSNPATYTGLADHIRDLFAQQPLSKELGYAKSRFSFNTKGGRCEECQGAGRIPIGMHLMGSVHIVCSACDGQRFNPDTFRVKYQGKNISEVLQLRVREAIPFFEGQETILQQLQTLQSVGLGYLSLGQPSTTLSGGEAQRIKLATELQRTDTGSTLYLLDQPTTGLHPEDVAVLLRALDRLAQRGNTLICIDNDQQVIRYADWLLDLGPGSGREGGQLVYEGIPAGILKHPTSLTGKYLEAPQPTTVHKKTGSSAAASIGLRGVSTWGLKDVDVDIPHEKLTVISGVSGSGKSSLAFGTLVAEAQNRFMENLSAYMRSILKQGNAASLVSASGIGPVIAIGRKYAIRSPRSTLGTLTGLHDLLRLLYSRTAQIQGLQLSARHFSFNHESGACPVCEGLGFRKVCSPAKLISAPHLPVFQGALLQNKAGKYYGDPHGQHAAILREVARQQDIDLAQAWEEIGESARDILLYGTGDKAYEVLWEFKNKTRSGSQALTAPWLGFCNYITGEYHRKLHNKDISYLEALMVEMPCESCRGKRIRPESLAVQWRGMDIGQFSAQPISQLLQMFEKMGAAEGLATPQIALESELRGPLLDLLGVMRDLGLAYLSPDRSSRSLSGGEGQRASLARALSAKLYGVTYVLDEPSIGLHPQDTQALLGVLRRLIRLGNTLVVVEHDLGIIRQADHIIEMGPGAGNKGGQVIFQGKLPELLENTQSPTAKYLKVPPVPPAPPKPGLQAAFGLKGCRKNNLQGMDADFAAGAIIAVTGLSGSGKSTLVSEVLLPSLREGRPVHCAATYGLDRFDKVHYASQELLSARGNSTVATFSGIMEGLRAYFAGSREAKALGLKKSAFSYQHKDGQCPECKGAGQLRTALDFLGDVWVPCEGCGGARYRAEVLACKLGGRNIAEALDLEVSEALTAFAQQKKVSGTLATLVDVGLGHLRLAQSCKTLSGGEAQRLKLSLQLLEKGKGESIYLFDEPSAGLHAQDVGQLLHLFTNLARQGHTVLYIEHHPAMIAAAEQVMELGPGAGAEGGRLVRNGLN